MVVEARAAGGEEQSAEWVQLDPSGICEFVVVSLSFGDTLRPFLTTHGECEMRKKLLSATGVLAAVAIVTLSAAPAADHHWTFDEAAGNVAVDSGTTGGVFGVIGTDVERIGGVVGSGALRFPGSGTFASAVDFGIGVGQFGTSDFTISFWFRTTATHNQELVGNRNDGSHGNFFSIRTAGGFVAFEVDQDGGGTNYAAAGTPSGYADGAWHQVYARRSGGHVSIVIDGMLFPGSTAAAPANIANGNSMIAGFSPGVQPCCNTAYVGDMDDLRVYNRALTDAEMIPPPDGDGDGVADENDNCSTVANADQDDDDADGSGNACDTDDDGDGVADTGDACPATPAGSVVNANGCSIAQLVPCGGRNHGAYVSAVAKATNDFVAAGLITRSERAALVSAAAQSNCGK